MKKSNRKIMENLKNKSLKVVRVENDYGFTDKIS